MMNNGQGATYLRPQTRSAVPIEQALECLFTMRQLLNPTESQTHSKHTLSSLHHRPYAQPLACPRKSQNHLW